MTFVLGVSPVCRMLIFHSTLPIKMAEQTAPVALQKTAVKAAGVSHPCPLCLTLNTEEFRSPSSEWEEDKETRCPRPGGAET